MSLGPGAGPEKLAYLKSQVMLMILVQGPHFENQKSNALSQFTNEGTGLEGSEFKECISR